MVAVNNRVQEHTVECSTSSTLCKPESKQTQQRVSGSGTVLVVNNSEVDQQSGRTDQDLRVPVLNMRGKPLMPTTPSEARRLLRDDKARVVSRKPFTIQLKIATGETCQPLTLGVDSGYKHVGVSVVDHNSKQEVLNAEIQLRTDIPKKLMERRMYRRNRRNRKWYRPPRFDNRKRDNGWLAPSIQQKLDSHLQIIRKIQQMLPITMIVVEVAGFDIQKIKNPEINGEQYQQGERLGFWNVREYVLHRDNHDCQHCHGKKKDPILQVHHIRGRMESGATNRPEELITVCKTCHEDHHQGKDIIPIDKKIKSFKPETFMTTVRWRLVNILQERFPDVNVSYTYGHITKNKRIREGIIKSHGNDAFAIAGGTRDTSRVKTIYAGQRRRNNRSIQLNRKGFKPSIRRQRYGLQPGDRVSVEGGGACIVKGMFNKGRWVRLQSQLDETMNRNVQKVRLICYGKGVFNI